MGFVAARCPVVVLSLLLVKERRGLWRLLSGCGAESTVVKGDGQLQMQMAHRRVLKLD